MRFIAIALLILASSLSFAGMDQYYVASVQRDGFIDITKSQDISLFSSTLPADAFERIASVCVQDPTLRCSMDAQKKVLTITERFPYSTIYSTLSPDYGFPYVTYTLVVKQIPTDRFAEGVENILVKANLSQAGEGTLPASLDLSVNNAESAAFLRMVGVNLTYAVVMPGAVKEAYSGNVTGVVVGERATFDLIEVFGSPNPIIIKSSELNGGYIVLAAAIVVLAAFAISFFGIGRKDKQVEKSALKQKPGKKG